MMIDTHVQDMIVEIEGNEYPLAPRTIEICEKLIEAERANVGKPVYRLWLAELEILLGKDACRKLFMDGRRENVDRLQMIYAGVAEAFNRTVEDLSTASRKKAMEDVATTLAPINEMMRHIREMDRPEPNRSGSIHEIYRK